MGIHTLKADLVTAIADPNFLSKDPEEVISEFQGDASRRLTLVAVKRAIAEETLTDDQSKHLNKIFDTLR